MTFGSLQQKSTESVNPGYGITYEYTIKLHNIGTSQKDFSYIFKGMSYHVDWQIDGKAGIGKDVRQSDDSGFGNYPEEVFRVNLCPGETKIIKIWVTMMTGSNPVSHNAFVINVDKNKLTDLGYDGTYHKGIKYNIELGNRWDIITYPYN